MAVTAAAGADDGVDTGSTMGKKSSTCRKQKRLRTYPLGNTVMQSHDANRLWHLHVTTEMSASGLAACYFYYC